MSALTEWDVKKGVQRPSVAVYVISLLSFEIEVFYSTFLVIKRKPLPN